MTAHVVTWVIVALATLGVLARPWRVAEWMWAVGGAVVLVAARLMTAGEALRGVASGIDVYLFLFGMMVLAEVARQHGVFAWLAGRAAKLAHGSPHRLFWLIFVVGALVTMFLSNDATAVVLTPAVAAVVKTMRVKRPLPYLYICAFVANAASFVLPISNPANLVIYGARMPSLLEWVPRFALPSALAIGATFVVLRLTQRRALRQEIADTVQAPALEAGGRAAALGIAATAVVLLAASAAHIALGLPTCLAGVATAIVVLVTTRSTPWPVLLKVAWPALALVAGLFVLVAALDKTGVVAAITRAFAALVGRTGPGAVWAGGGLVAVAGNLTNNLPASLVMGSVLGASHVPHAVTGAVLIGIDLGPNLSITGSLASVLWLQALRREGIQVSAWAFLQLGAIVMLPALALALSSLVLVG